MSEVTPTNPVVSVVPVPTQLVYSGTSTVAFSDRALLSAQLAGQGAGLAGKAVYTCGQRA